MNATLHSHGDWGMSRADWMATTAALFLLALAWTAGRAGWMALVWLLIRTLLGGAFALLP